MDTGVIVLTATVAAGALLLLWAGLDHIREPAVLARHLAISKPPGAGRLLATGVGAAEVVTGVGVLVALGMPVTGGRWALIAQGMLYAGFLGHLAVRYRRNDRGDCACARVGARIGKAGLLRAGALSSVSVVAAVGYPAIALHRLGPTDPEPALALAGSVVLCLLLHALPAAVDGLSRPTGNRRHV